MVLVVCSRVPLFVRFVVVVCMYCYELTKDFNFFVNLLTAAASAESAIPGNLRQIDIFADRINDFRPDG